MPTDDPSGDHASMFSRILARLPVYLADLRDDPKWLLMFVFGRIIPLRRLAAALHRKTVAPPNTPSLFQGHDVEGTVRSLCRDGIATGTGLQLPPPVVNAIREFAIRTPCFGNLDRGLAFRFKDHAQAQTAYGCDILVGHFFEKIEDCPQITSIRTDSALLQVAGLYLGSALVVTSSRLWWTFPADSSREALLKRASLERLHFDMNDWRSVKFFFYLTDVDDESGPHIYIKTSHRKKRWRDQFTLFVGKPNAEIVGYYGAGNVAKICGPAGTCFAEDPFGFHMGTVVRRNPRLIMEIEFGVSPPTARRFFGDLPDAADPKRGE
jgi:hypothetical protein